MPVKHRVFEDSWCRLIEWMKSVIDSLETQWDGIKYKIYFHFWRPLYVCTDMPFSKGVEKTVHHGFDILFKKADPTSTFHPRF